MPVLVGYANGNKYYYNSDGSGGATLEVPEDGVDSGISSTLVINSLEDEMAYYGMTPEEIQNVMNKINGVSSLESNPKPATITDPITGNTTISPNGSLLSNSAQSLKNTTEFQKATIELEKQKLQAMNTQNEIQKKQLDLMDYNLIMQGQIFTQLAELNENLNKQTIAISNQTLKTIVNVDTTKLSEANAKIAEYYDKISISQNAINEKSLEKLNKELEKDITFEGKTYSKVELEKLKDLETLKNVKDENETLLNDALELVEDFMTDGFDVAYNPLAFILGELKTEFSKDSAEIETKYNLKGAK